MKIIPAIDILNGKCVRLTKGDFSTQKIYNESPLEVAKEFEANGITHLHLVDLDGAREKKIINWEALNEISSNTDLRIDFGGGLKSNEDLKIAFDNGAHQITGGSIAVTNEKLFGEWISIHGSEKIILGADANHDNIAISGWQEETNETIGPFIKKYTQKGIQYCICTDIGRDGMMQGPNVFLYKKILKENPDLKLIASGGVSSMKDIADLQKNGLFGAITGKAIYEKKISLKEICEFNKKIIQK